MPKVKIRLESLRGRRPSYLKNLNKRKPPYWPPIASAIIQAVACILQLAVLLVVFRQFKVNKGAADLNKEVAKLNEESADRVWSFQLITTLYESGDCREANCPPVAHRQIREAAVKAYILIEKKYKRSIKLRGITLDNEIDLRGEEFPRADLTGAILRSANLEKAKFPHALLEEADLTGATLNDATLTGTNLFRAILVDAQLKRARLGKANLDGATFGDCSNQEFDTASGVCQRGCAVLTGARLKEASLDDAILCGVDLSGADLRKAKLRRANFFAANFSRVNLDGANLNGADLTYARNLTQGQLDRARGDIDTKIPKNGNPKLERPKHWK